MGKMIIAELLLLLFRENCRFYANSGTFSSAIYGRQEEDKTLPEPNNTDPPPTLQPQVFRFSPNDPDPFIATDPPRHGGCGMKK